MKKVLKRSLAIVLGIILTVGMLCTGVSAAEDLPVKVELDGKAVNFTDAEPQIVDGRTYVPFRAVFEALGAEVGYDEAAAAVSASRNGVTVLIPIGSSEITVDMGSYSYADYMDAAAFVSDAGRTYIPVRYAAEALGCCVGWDANNRTVILVDTSSMVEKAFAGGQFTLLRKYMDYAEKFNQGSYEVSLDMDMSCTVLATEVMSMDCQAKGVTSGQSAAQMSMTMKMDLAGLVDLLARLGDAGMKEEITASLAEAGFEDLSMEVEAQARLDMEKGAMYMNMSGVPGMEEVLPADTWLFIDLSEILGGMDLGDMERIFEAVSPSQMAAAFINEMSYIYDKDSAYNEIKTQVDAIVGAFADSAFVKNGQSYTNTQKIDDIGLTITLRLDTNAAGDVAGYETGVDLTVPAETLGLNESVFAQMDELGKQLGVTLRQGDVKLTARAGINEQNKETLKFELGMGNLVVLTINADGSYTPTSKTPETGLPAGAKSIGLEQWIAGIQ